MKLINKIKLLPDAVKGQLFNDPKINGEYRFLKKLLSTNERLVIFDVGANTGYYSEKILSINQNVEIYCFEPVKNTFIKLSGRLGSYSNVKLYNFGLGERTKEDEIFIYDKEAGSNSLYFDERYLSNNRTAEKENILIRKLDDVINELTIDKIDFLKIDVEANESNVLNGTIQSLKKGIIRTLQFEYSDYWKKSSSKLEDVFNLLVKNNYQLFRLTPWGKLSLRKFSSKLENYKHANYLAILKV